jgi:hypothetical protein
MQRVALGVLVLIVGGCRDDVRLDLSRTTARAGVEPGKGGPDGELRAGTEFYVAPDGDDANPGTESQPFLSLERARTAVRGALASGGTGPIRVWLREGIYRRSGPFELAPEDSGRGDRRIMWAAYPGERVEISGLRRIDGPWTASANGVWSAPAQGLRFSTLFVNGDRATRARTPNAPGTYDMMVRAECCNDMECPGGPEMPPASPRVDCLDRFKPQPGTVRADWRNLHDVEIVSRRRWEQSRLRIERVDETGNWVFVRAETADFAFGFDYDGTDRYYVDNVFEALDRPGEWYLDAPADRLYYMSKPGTDPNQATIEAPVTDELLRAGDVRAAADVVSEDLVIVPDDDDLRFGTTSFSIAAWLNLPASIPECYLLQENPPNYSGSCNQPVLCRGDAFNAQGYCVMMNRVHDQDRAWVSLQLRDTLDRVVRSPPVEVPAPDPTTNGVWKHYAWVVDRAAGVLRTYVDGNPAPEVALADGTEPLGDIGTWHSFAVGRLNGPIYGEPFRYEAAVDELHVVAGALTAAGVQSLYANNTQSEAPERLHLGFETPVPTPAEIGRPIVMRGRLRTLPGAVGNGAVFNEPPPVDGFAGYLENVTFRGLEFRGTDASLRADGYHGSQGDHRLELPPAISLVTRNVVFTRGAVTGTGAAAIRVFGVDTEVSANEIRDTGSSGIEIGRLPPREPWTTYGDSFVTWFGAGANLARRVSVLDNRLHAIGRRFPSATAVRIARNSHNRVAGNRIYDTGYSGISLGWFTPSTNGPNPIGLHNNVIEQNEVHDTMGVLNDGGGIYVLGSQRGTVVRNNVVHDIRLTPMHRPRKSHDGDLLLGIYLDGTTAYVTVTGNVTYRTDGAGLLLGSGFSPPTANHDNRVVNNVFVDGMQFQTMFLFAIHDTFFRNIVYATRPTPAQAPFFYMPLPGTVRPTIGASDHNLFYRADGNYAQQLDAWRDLGYDASSLQGVDPLFVDPAHDDYTVPPDSPAVRELGFVPITTHAGPPPAYCFDDRDCAWGGLRCIQRECR